MSHLHQYNSNNFLEEKVSTPVQDNNLKSNYKSLGKNKDVDLVDKGDKLERIPELPNEFNPDHTQQMKIENN